MVCQVGEQGRWAQGLQLSAFTMAWSWRIFYDCTETKGVYVHVCMCTLKENCWEIQSVTLMIADHTSRYVCILACLLFEEDHDGMWRKIWKTNPTVSPCSAIFANQSRFWSASLEHLIWEASLLMLLSHHPLSYPDLSQTLAGQVSVAAITKSTRRKLAYQLNLDFADLHRCKFG